MTNDLSTTSSINGTRSLGELLHNQPDTFETVITNPDDTAIILYTSGTTGQPKGAELATWSKENMADYKYPRFIEFRVVLPTMATGEILKNELR